MGLIKDIDYFRQRGVPILGVSVSDQPGWADSFRQEAKVPVVSYDTVSGLLAINQAGQGSIASMKNTLTSMKSVLADSLGKNAVVAGLDIMSYLPEETVVLLHNAELHYGTPGFIQAVQNLRNKFKTNRRTLCLMSAALVLPDFLAGDVVNIDIPNPTRDEIKDKIKSTSGMEFDLTKEELDAVSGLPMFQVEQAVALSVKREGGKKDGKIVRDINQMLRLKKQLISSSPGLSVWEKHVSFDNIGGLKGVKSFFHKIFAGPQPPAVVVWIDEIEKSSLANTGDSNGINSDMLGTVLSYMEDSNVFGVMLNGVSGSGKSEMVKSLGGQFNRLVIRLDIASLKGQFVGQSERNLRAALKAISSVSDNNAMFVATSNWIDNLDDALNSRFCTKFYFGLPSKEERNMVWDIQRSRYGLDDKALPKDVGWVGRNIKQCCELAWKTDQTILEASSMIIPAGVASADEIEKLNTSAAGRLISAESGSVYQGAM